jgi:hypothetical protein
MGEGQKEGGDSPDNHSQGIRHLVSFVEEMIILASHFVTIQGQESIFQVVDMILISIDHELDDRGDRVEFFVI